MICINILNNYQQTLSAVSKQGRALKNANLSLRSDKDIVLKAVSNDGSALEFATENLRADKDIVLKAVSNYGLALHP